MKTLINEANEKIWAFLWKKFHFGLMHTDENIKHWLERNSIIVWQIIWFVWWMNKNRYFFVRFRVERKLKSQQDMAMATKGVVNCMDVFFIPRIRINQKFTCIGVAKNIGPKI